MARYTNLQSNEIQEILNKYGLEVLEYQPIEEGAGNSSYWVRTYQKQFVLTVFEIERTRVVNLCKLLLLLEEYQYPTTRIQKLTNGDAITAIHGKPVLLKPYIVGQLVKNLDENRIRQVGTEMALLHKIPSPDYLPDHHTYGLQTFQALLGEKIDLEYENWLAQKHKMLSKEMPSGLPKGLIHGDVFYDNVLFEGETIKSLIDFEEACHYYKIFDLGMAVIGLCTENLSIKLEKVRALVDGYQSVRALEENEKESLQYFIEYAAIATSSWRFWNYNIQNPDPEKSEKHYEMVKIAQDAKAIPAKEFLNRIFG